MALNGAITSGVSSLISEQRIEDFVENYAFMESSYTSLLNEFNHARSGQSNMRELDGNVNRMKSFLVSNIGADWATATAANQVSRLGIDSRGIVPWDEVRTAMMRTGVLTPHLLL